MGRLKAELIDGMVVVGELAYLPAEWERLERRRATGRAYYARNREQRLATVKSWQAANPERVRELNREHMRRRRLSGRVEYRVIGSLHGLTCTGPTKRSGCRCSKVTLLRRVEAPETGSGEQANGYNRDAFSRDGIAPSERNRIHSDSSPAPAAIPARRRGRSVHRGIDR